MRFSDDAGDTTPHVEARSPAPSVRGLTNALLDVRRILRCPRPGPSCRRWFRSRRLLLPSPPMPRGRLTCRTARNRAETDVGEDLQTAASSSRCAAATASLSSTPRVTSPSTAGSRAVELVACERQSHGHGLGERVGDGEDPRRSGRCRTRVLVPSRVSARPAGPCRRRSGRPLHGWSRGVAGAPIVGRSPTGPRPPS